jgi:DNA-binding MarR family transcriptional regulator
MGIHSASSPKTARVTGESFYDLRRLLSYRLYILSNTLGKGAVRLYARRYGVSLAEWRLLAALAPAAPSSVNALALAIRTDKSWVSRTASALVERGLLEVKKVPSDARRLDIQLTSAGRALYARILPAATRRQRRLLSALSANELKSLERILDKLQRRADTLLAESDEPSVDTRPGTDLARRPRRRA